MHPLGGKIKIKYKDTLANRYQKEWKKEILTDPLHCQPKFGKCWAIVNNN